MLFISDTVIPLLAADPWLTVMALLVIFWIIEQTVLDR